MRKLATVAALLLVAAACSKTEAPAAGAPASAGQKGLLAAPAATPLPPGARPVVEIVTSKGTIEAELHPDRAPLSVRNFLAYVEKKHYDGTIFHRVIGPPKNFMIQGGGFLPDMTQKPTDPPVKNEADNGLKNERSTLAFARTRIVDSATSQFFINLKHNAMLDHVDKSDMGYGYAVFGKVLKGMEVVDAIASVPTGQKGPFGDVPNEPVMINSVRVKK